MRSSTRSWIRDGLGALALLALGIAAPQAAPGPREVVEQTSEQVIAVLNEPGLSREARRERVEAIVIANMDFPTVSRLVLARNWSRFSPQQQEEFMREFQRHLAATYGRRLDEYQNETVTILSDRREANGDWTVRSKIVRGADGRNDILVDYRLREIAGQWKIIDFIIEQVSLVANFRAQFQDMVARGGPEHVLQVLREKTAKGEAIAS